MPFASICGYSEVNVIKDPEQCRWAVSNMSGDVLFWVSFKHAFNPPKYNPDLYAALYTALCYEPLTPADIENTFKRFPSLRGQRMLAIDPRDRPVVSSVSPPLPTAEPPKQIAPIKIGPRRIK